MERREKEKGNRRERRKSGIHFHEDNLNKSRETELGGDRRGETKRKCENKLEKLRKKKYKGLLRFLLPIK